MNEEVEMNDSDNRDELVAVSMKNGEMLKMILNVMTR